MESGNPLFDHAVPGVVQSHPRVAVALHVMGVLLETEQGQPVADGSLSEGGRELTSDEQQLKKSATNILTQYLNGEAILDSLQMYPNVAEHNLSSTTNGSQSQVLVVRNGRRRRY